MNMVQLGRMAGYFSLAQWQELELQALIFRHMVAGAAVPPELLLLVKKSLAASSPSPYCNPLQFYPHYQSALGRAADLEPGRCRRTDGKKWRCSRDVMAGHKYCERHMNRGKNRSRKHVEAPTQEIKQRPRESTIDDTNCPLEALSGHGGARALRPFFDDWPRSVPETNDASTNLCISPLGNSASGFSLQLGTANEDDERRHSASSQMSWVAASGGPLAEALRSSDSGSASSPTNLLLHRFLRNCGAETSS